MGWLPELVCSALWLQSLRLPLRLSLGLPRAALVRACWPRWWQRISSARRGSFWTELGFPLSGLVQGLGLGGPRTLQKELEWGEEGQEGKEWEEEGKEWEEEVKEEEE